MSKGKTHRFSLADLHYIKAAKGSFCPGERAMSKGKTHRFSLADLHYIKASAAAKGSFCPGDIHQKSENLPWYYQYFSFGVCARNVWHVS